MRRWVPTLQVIGLGWYVALSILAGVLGGLWLDRHLKTGLVFTLVGLLLGLALAFYGLYRMVQPFLGQGRNGPKSDREEGT